MATTSTQTEHEMHEFEGLVVREYLKRAGFSKTLQSFDAECMARNNPGSKNRSNSTEAAQKELEAKRIGVWYRFSRAIDIPRLRRHIFGSALQTRKEGFSFIADRDDGEIFDSAGYDFVEGDDNTGPLLNLFIRYLCLMKAQETELEKVEETKNNEAPIKSKPESPNMASSPVPHRASVVNVSASKVPYVLERRKNDTSSVDENADLDEVNEGIALLDEALAMDDLRRDSILYATALEMPIHEHRFNSISGDLTVPTIMTRSGDPPTEAEKNAAQNGGKKPRTSSVEELTRQLETAAMGEENAARLRHKQKQRRASLRKLLQPLDMSQRAKLKAITKKAGGIDDSQETLQAPVSLTNTKSSSLLEGAYAQRMAERKWMLQHRHMEHPATYAVTFRIMDRDIKVGHANATQRVRVAKDLQRVRQRMAPEQMVLLQEKYAGKPERRCALCEKSFNALNLPMNISYKAIMDLRESWGVHVRPDAKRSRAPRCYDEVRVCLFCSQFFNENAAYRLPAKDIGDVDTQLAEFQKSIEHLDPRHESAFFRP